jgi:Ca2+-binding EF-hand superfamily protein
VAVASDAGSTGFGTRHKAAHVNFYRVFQQLDLDQSGSVTKDEFTKTVRRALGVTTAALSDAELSQASARRESESERVRGEVGF